MSLAILLFGDHCFTAAGPGIPRHRSADRFDHDLYRGASPNVIETEITDILEEQFSTIEGVKTLTSSSQEQGSVITIEFELGRDVDEAANDVRDRVSRVRGTLPREADDPIVEKVDVNAQPIVWLALSATRHTRPGIDRYRGSGAEGADPAPAGGGVGFSRGRAPVCDAGLARRAADGLARLDHRGCGERHQARERGDPGGTCGRGRAGVLGPDARRPCRPRRNSAPLSSSRTANDVVRLGDVAEVTLGAADDRTAVRYNGQPAIGLGIVKQSKASTLDVAGVVDRRSAGL